MRQPAGVVQRGGRPLALTVLMVVLFLTFLDNTVVSVALGSVQSTLRAGVTALQWVVSSYALTFAAAMLAFGMIGDEFGRKRVMLAGAGVFCMGSVLCALASNVQLLIAGRVVMGIGAEASEPGTLSMLRHLYPEEGIRTRAIGVWTAVCGLALALGPVVGGVLVGVWDWRAIFWFKLAFGLAALTVGAAVLPESADPDAHRVDIAGTVLGAAAWALFLWTLVRDATTPVRARPGRCRRGGRRPTGRDSDHRAGGRLLRRARPRHRIPRNAPGGMLVVVLAVSPAALAGKIPGQGGECRSAGLGSPVSAVELLVCVSASRRRWNSSTPISPRASRPARVRSGVSSSSPRLPGGHMRRQLPCRIMAGIIAMQATMPTAMTKTTGHPQPHPCVHHITDLPSAAGPLPGDGYTSRTPDEMQG